MDVAVLAQCQGQQHFQSALVSVMVAEPHHADLMLLEAHQGGAMVTTVRRDDIPEDTTVTKGAVVAMVVEA